MQGNQFAAPQKNSLGAAPSEGPMVVPVFIDFTVQLSYKLDLTYIQQQGRMSMIQTIYVDNSGNPQALTILTDTVNQSVKVPAYCQAYIPVAVTNKMALTFTTSGQVVVPVHVLNVAMNAAVWVAGQNPPVVNASGGITISDPILESGVVGGYYQNQQYVLASGGALMPVAEGTKILSGTIATTTATTIFTGTPGFILTRLKVLASPDAILGTAGRVKITATEVGVGEVAHGWAWLPTAVPTGLTGPVTMLDISPNYTSKLSGSAFQLMLSATPTGGEIFYTASYALVSFFGG